MEGRRQLSIPRFWAVTFWGRWLPRPLPTAGRDVAATVPRPVPIAVPGLPSVLLHGAGVRQRILAKLRLGHAPP